MADNDQRPDIQADDVIYREPRTHYANNVATSDASDTAAVAFSGQRFPTGEMNFETRSRAPAKQTVQERQFTHRENVWHAGCEGQNIMNPHLSNTYDLILASDTEDRRRRRIETLVYAALILTAVVAISQAVVQTVTVPSRIAAKNCAIEYCA